MATAHHKISRDAAFILATEGLRDVATIMDQAMELDAPLGLAPVEQAMRTYCCDPNDHTRAELMRVMEEFRATRRASALARWRGADGAR
jgi:hypothetical protein